MEDSVQSGDVVLIQDEAFPRFQWPLGIIQQVYPGRDGRIRSAQVKTANGVLVRPIQRIHQLEICDRIRDSLPSDSQCPNSHTPVGDPSDTAANFTNTHDTLDDDINTSGASTSTSADNVFTDTEPKDSESCVKTS